MTYNEGIVLCELLEVENNYICAKDRMIKFITDNQEGYWLVIDDIRKMLENLYNAIIDEVNLINCARENNIINTKIDYEDHYKFAKEELNFIQKVKDTFSMDWA